ncbi:zinc knuckle CX2CX4HX4C containing protein [Tanacetum coccineum]
MKRTRLNVMNALAYIGASINVMPFSMFKRLSIGNLQPTSMIIEMVDLTKKAPRGIIENVLVQIEKFIFSVYFIVIDIVEDPKAPLIFERPLIATSYLRIDVFNKQISSGVATSKGKRIDIASTHGTWMIEQVFQVGTWIFLDEAFLEHVLGHAIIHTEQIQGSPSVPFLTSVGFSSSGIF